MGDPAFCVMIKCVRCLCAVCAVRCALCTSVRSHHMTAQSPTRHYHILSLSRVSLRGLHRRPSSAWQRFPRLQLTPPPSPRVTDHSLVTSDPPGPALVGRLVDYRVVSRTDLIDRGHPLLHAQHANRTHRPHTASPHSHTPSCHCPSLTNTLIHILILIFIPTLILTNTSLPLLHLPLP